MPEFRQQICREVLLLLPDSSGCFRASIVARTTFCLLLDPRDFVRMFLIPAISSTLRAGPPAMTTGTFRRSSSAVRKHRRIFLYNHVEYLHFHPGATLISFFASIFFSFADRFRNFSCFTQDLLQRVHCRHLQLLKL